MKRILIIIIVLITFSCIKKTRYNTGHFKESVVNFEDVNSEYDDYNSTAPFIYNRFLFHFSSNRNSLGGDFDIVGEKMYIDWSKTNGTINIGTNLSEDRFDYLMPVYILQTEVSYEEKMCIIFIVSFVYCFFVDCSVCRKN